VGSSPKAICALAETIHPNENHYINIVMLYNTEPPKSNPHQEPVSNKEYQQKLCLFNV
jgi:hypothetical protein